MENKKALALIGNTRARKAEDKKNKEKFWSFCTTEEKDLWIQASRREKLSLAAWQRRVLNAEVERQQPNTLILNNIN